MGHLTIGLIWGAIIPDDVHLEFGDDDNETDGLFDLLEMEKQELIPRHTEIDGLYGFVMASGAPENDSEINMKEEYIIIDDNLATHPHALTARTKWTMFVLHAKTHGVHSIPSGCLHIVPMQVA